MINRDNFRRKYRRSSRL